MRKPRAYTGKTAQQLCPIDGCGYYIPFSYMMCSTHWRMVPQHLQRRVWSAWRDGDGAGSDAHRAAKAAAVEAVDAALRLQETHNAKG